jgi:hypothetical protein
MSSNRSITTILGAAAIACAVTATPSRAAAQEADPVTPTGKGIAGGILLGAEVVMIPLGIAGVDAWWPYLVFGLVGAGGGAIGGCAVEGSEGACSSFMTTEIPAEAAVGMLAGGMALVIPTLVVVLNATAYDPEKELDEGDEKKRTPGEEEEIEVEGKRRTLPLAVVGVDATGKRTRVRPGIPAVEVRPMYTPEEVAVWGVEQETEVVVPLVRGRF